MDSFNTIQPSVSETRFSDSRTSIEKQIHRLERDAVRRHLRHAGSWLLRAAFVALVYAYAALVIESAVGGAIQWTALVLSAYLLVYIVKGHRDVQSRKQAQLYWLRDDTAHARPESTPAPDKPVVDSAARPQMIIAGALESDETPEDAGWVKKQALS